MIPLLCGGIGWLIFAVFLLITNETEQFLRLILRTVTYCLVQAITNSLHLHWLGWVVIGILVVAEIVYVEYRDNQDDDEELL